MSSHPGISFLLSLLVKLFHLLKVAAQAGQNVTIIDINADLLDKAQKSIQTNLTRVGKKLYKGDAGKIDAFVKEASERIKVSTKLEDGAEVDLIVEAIVEKLDVKQELFNKLDKVRCRKCSNYFGDKCHHDVSIFLWYWGAN